MKYDPTATNQTLIPSGTWCQAQIVNAIDTVSKSSGNDMIQADFEIYDSLGLRPMIRHYFVSKQPGFFKKLCTAIDFDFDSGEIPARELVGKMMWVLIKIQQDTTGEYPDKNVLAAFSKNPPEGHTPVAQSQVSNGVDVPEKEDLPF